MTRLDLPRSVGTQRSAMNRYSPVRPGSGSTCVPYNHKGLSCFLSADVPITHSLGHVVLCMQGQISCTGAAQLTQ